jgi:predicted DNA-binding transcriptional regulator AlpA
MSSGYMQSGFPGRSANQEFSRRASNQPDKQPPPSGSVAIKPVPVDRLLTTKQVSVILNIAVETLKKWRQRGKGPKFVRLEGLAIRYLLSEVLKYVSDQSVQK